MAFLQPVMLSGTTAPVLQQIITRLPLILLLCNVYVHTKLHPCQSPGNIPGSLAKMEKKELEEEDVKLFKINEKFAL